jgi:hypothetical protein
VVYLRAGQTSLPRTCASLYELGHHVDQLCTEWRIYWANPSHQTIHQSLTSLVVWLISHQPAVVFSQSKLATNNQPTLLFLSEQTCTSHDIYLGTLSRIFPRNTSHDIYFFCTNLHPNILFLGANYFGKQNKAMRRVIWTHAINTVVLLIIFFQKNNLNLTMFYTYLLNKTSSHI